MQEMSSDAAKKAVPTASIAPRRIRNYQYAVAYQSVAGIKNEEIAKSVGLKVETVRAILNRPDIKELCQKIHWHMYGKDIKKRLEHILPKAIDVNEKLMCDELVRPSIRKDIAADFMDRTLGKPVQPLNVQTSSIKELLVTIRQKEVKKPVDAEARRAKNEAIDAEFAEIKDSATSSEDIEDVERWVRDNLGEDDDA